MFKVPNKYRERNHPILGSDDSVGNAGLFMIPHQIINDYVYRVFASDGGGWEHASIQVAEKGIQAHRCPTWEEMCYIKEMFWEDEDCVVQYHPKKSEYVNVHPFVLHLWRPTNQEVPQPPKKMIG